LNEEVKVSKRREIDADLIVKQEENLRVMTDEEFNLLCQSIRENGYCEPIQVVGYTEDAAEKSEWHRRYAGKFLIVNGNHRYEALTKVFGMKKIPCEVLGWNWDEDRYWQEAIRLNNIRGEFDKVALAKAVIKLYERLKKKYDKDTIKRKLGFAGAKTQFDYILAQVEKTIPPEIKKKLKSTKRELETIEDLSNVLNDLFRKYGKTVENHWMYFVFGGKEHVMIKCDATLWSLVKALMTEIEINDLDAREVFAEMIKRRLGLE